MEVLSYNPYFIGNHSATVISGRVINQRAQLQSLFYWKSFCNKNDWVDYKRFKEVTILILLEIILQRQMVLMVKWSSWCYNPYFIGNHSATWETRTNVSIVYTLQSLFYWKSFCNAGEKVWSTLSTKCYNPYFIGNHSATEYTTTSTVSQKLVTILILLEIILQQECVRMIIEVHLSVTILILLEIILQRRRSPWRMKEDTSLQSLFYWKSFCNMKIKV